jgi:uncharacterized repeat protein (TIGR01451 family)
MDNSCTGESTFPIPADGDVSYRIPGVFTVENGTITSASAYSSVVAGGGITKQITLTGTATSGADVLILFGAHLARDYEWGADRGAHEWPTGTATLGFINYSGGGSGSTNVKISDNILDNPSSSDIAVFATDTPDPVGAGHNLSYNIMVNNSGPLSSNADTVTDAIPAGTTFASATTAAGWTMTTPAVGGSGTVQWILSGSLAAGASASFGMVVAVDANATGTVENTAALTSGTVDAYQINNTAHTSTTILGTCTMPVVTSDPANVSVIEGANADFSASASGTPAPAIQWQVMPSGGAFSDISGATDGSLSFATSLAQNGNQYRARFSNACGTVYSAAATLTVNPANTAPVVTITGPQVGGSFAVGVAVPFTGSFTDAAGDTHSAVWSIGDVNVAGVVNDTTGSVAASYTFSTPGTYAIKLTVTDQHGASGMSTQVFGQAASVTVSVTAGVPGKYPRRDPALGAQPVVAVQFGLAQNAPNPFRSTTQVRFGLPVQCRVKLGVFDVAGRQVATLSDQVWEPGSHALDWSGRTDGGTLARGGVYIIQMVARSTTGNEHFHAQRTVIRID